MELLEIPLDKLKGIDFLDVGCGNGLFARTVALQYQANVIAADISTGVEIGRRASSEDESIDFVQTDLRYPPFKKESFDVIWCAGSIHHTENPRLIFKKLTTFLKEGGRIFVWVYAMKEKNTFRWYAKRMTKNIVCILPVFFQDLAVFLIACFTVMKQFILFKVLGKKLEIPYVQKLRHHRMMARDYYAVRYDWCLTVEEVSEWHKECGLKSIYSMYVKESDGYWVAGLAQKK